MTQLLIYILLISIILLFIISIIYTLVIKPRNLIIKRLIDENINETKLAELRDKIKNNIKSQITKIKGKFIKIGDNFDDLSIELKNELAKCYQEGGCFF